MQHFYCKDVLSHIENASTNESIFRCDGYNLSLKDHQNRHRLLSVDFFNTPILTTAPNQVVPCRCSAFGFSSPSNNEWGFKGERKDLISNSYLLGNGRRLYNPSIMRFTSPDPLSPLSKGGLNCYAFTLNDPINNSDPTGLFIQRAVDFIAQKIMPKKTYSGNIVWQHDGIIAFTNKRRTDGNLDTLYISSHGAPGILTGDEYSYTAIDIYRILEHKSIKMQGRQTHILACNSSTPKSFGGYSFADEMAKLTGAQSSGYDRFVSVSDEIDKSGKILSHRLWDPLTHFLGLATSTKVRRGNIRNPHKTQSTGPGGRHW